MNDANSLSDRAVIRLAGEDRFSFLQGLITQNADRLNREPAIFAALLTPQGKILFDFFVAPAPDAFFIDCSAATAPALLKRLALYKLRAKVSLEIDETLCVRTDANELKDGLAYADPRHAEMGWRAIVRDGDAAADGAYDRRRIALGVPEANKDFAGDEIFLTDANYDALDGVSYKKGCFIGQEVSSRMKRKGEIRRRTLIAEFDGPAPAKGAPVIAGATTLGEIMSSSGRAALALIRLDRWEKAQAQGKTAECEDQPLRLRIPDYLEQV